ncbi:hypothetical protein K4K49_003026 [Colletotrichum sp. SAR 10_70]|nr:hypothetical protein K4K50_011046 [Colletotrichum sp. SAR 10_71]KAI8173936.1 hypothetical protein K4K49_003026 [Colletotrichum sp. SAR 10_70]KAI8181940.1 hypothetical protein K4K51_001418 [Colletotrichum sp. SAR 10_75]KAI8247164.1 hypothetical protein K4K53_002146 [Colletotrichum sp. SAR 10_77]
MKFFSAALLGLMTLTSALASPMEPASANLQARDQNDFRWLSKRCCINCDNPYASCNPNDKREAVETEGDAIFGTEKRCCINCMNPCSNCSGKGPGGQTCGSKRRDEGHAEWPAKRCCINCDNPYAQCRSMDRREAFGTLEDALFVSP